MAMYKLVRGVGLMAAIGKALGLPETLLSMKLELDCKGPPKVTVEFYADEDRTLAMTEAISGTAEAQHLAEMLKVE